MKNIAVLGNEEFTLGFRLAGIKKVINITKDDAADKTMETLADKSIGVLILMHEDVTAMPIRVREKIESSVQPVCVVLSRDSAGEDDLRRKVKKSIGIDVWNKE